MAHAFPHFGMVLHLLLQFDLNFFSPTLSCLDLVLCLLLYLSRFRLILEKGRKRPRVWRLFHCLRPYLLHVLLLLLSPFLPHESFWSLPCPPRPPSPQFTPFPLFNFPPSFCGRVGWQKTPLSSEQSSPCPPSMLQSRWQKQSQQVSLRETWRLEMERLRHWANNHL